MGRDAISELRRVVARWDWNEFHDVLDRALTGLPPERMVAVAEAILRRELPEFERHHPGVTWPRRALDNEADDLSPESELPGGNAFLSGVEELTYARDGLQDAAVCRRWGREAIASGIVAAMARVWGMRHRDRWNQWFYRTHLGRPCSEPQPRAGWEQDPQVKEVEASLGTELIDRLEAAWDGVTP